MIRTTTVVVIASALLLSAAPARADTYGEELNSVGNPDLAKKKKSGPNDSGLQLGLRTGFGLPLGKPWDTPGDMAGDVRGIIPVWIDAGYRINPSIYVGAYGSLGFAIMNTSSNPACSSGGSCSATDIRFGVDAHYHFSPGEDFDPWVGLGVGYEFWNLKLGIPNTLTYSRKLKGFEFLDLQVGGDMKVATDVAVGPFVSFSLGQFSHAKVTSSTAAGTSVQDDDIKNTAMHYWLMLGLRGAFNL